MKYLVLAFALATAAATAQTGNWVPGVLPEGATGPMAEGIHNCLSSYPERERTAHIEGITSLAYRIAEDGSVTGVKVTKSSGNTALDGAAVACVKTWRYNPSMQAGKPVEIAWRNDVKWAIEARPVLEFPPPPVAVSHITLPQPITSGNLPPASAAPNSATPSGAALPASPPPPPPGALASSIGRPHVCLSDYPADAVAERSMGTTTIGFTITVEGRVENLHTIVSSGYASLDDAALTCASTWRYKPAIKDSQPIAVPWKAEVKWLIH